MSLAPGTACGRRVDPQLRVMVTGAGEGYISRSAYVFCGPELDGSGYDQKYAQNRDPGDRGGSTCLRERFCVNYWYNEPIQGNRVVLFLLFSKLFPTIP